MPVNLTTQEEQLKIAFDDIGPMLTVAKPESLLNDLGASRVRYKNEEWKKKVHELMCKAGLVIIRAEGGTEGLLWEMNEVFKIKNPEQIIFLLPDKQKEFDAFCNTILQEINVSLPACKITSSVSDFSGLLYFDNKKKPFIKPINVESFMGPAGEMFNHISISIKKALKQINPTFFTYKYEKVKIKERAKAFLYDFLILAPLSLLIGVILMLVFKTSANDGIFGGGFLAFMAIQLFYPLFSELYSIKGTFGKRKMGFYVSDKEHIKPTAQQIFLRCFFRFISFLPFFFITIPYTILAGYKNLPLIHDYLSRTRIFRNII